MTIVLEKVQEVAWKEYNPEFGNQVLVSDHGDDNACFRDVEFEAGANTTIRLREKTQIHHSTGLAIWNCSRILSGHLMDNPGLVKDQKVLELGAGVGLVGIVAHHLNADQVIVTDGDTDVMANLSHNVYMNRRDDHNENSQSSLSCRQLVWGRNLTTFQQEQGFHSVILATDVLYSSKCVEPLWQTVDELLAPDGLFLLAFCPHSVTMDEVLDKAEQLGFQWACPNISECVEDEEEESKDSLNDFGLDRMVYNDFGYHVFHFKRIL